MRTKFKNTLAVTMIITAGIILFQFIANQQTPDKPLPSRLHPTVAEKADRLVQLTEEKGITILITDGFRSVAEQDALFNQGRTTDGNIVTNVEGGESYHNYGLAIDFALQLPDGSVIWDLKHDGNGNGESDWMEVVTIAKELGFTWGGDWQHFRDYPHLQMDFGLSIGQLKRGKRPEGLDY